MYEAPEHFEAVGRRSMLYAACITPSASADRLFWMKADAGAPGAAAALAYQGNPGGTRVFSGM